MIVYNIHVLTYLSKQAQNLCIDASVEQRKAKVSKGKESQHLLKSMKSLKTFESWEKIQIV